MATNGHARAEDVCDDDLTNEDLQDLHEDILDRNEDGVRSLLREFVDQGLPIERLCCTEVELEPAPHDHKLNWLSLTALHRASLIDSHGILDAILSSVPNIDINIGLKKTGYTPLHVAASAGVLPAVNYLTSSGTCIDAKDHAGSTPMHLAAETGSKDVIALLCVRGAELNLQNNKGHTPLHLAALMGHIEVVDLLLNKDADLKVKDIDGQTPLHTAQVKGFSHVTEKLLDKGADVNAVDNNGNTAMHTWIQHRKGSSEKSLSSTSFTALVRHHCDIDICNHDGATALHLAVSSGDDDVLQFLINQEADINAMNKVGQSPIFLARSLDVLELLIMNGAECDVVDSKQNSVLHVYAGNDDVAVCMMKAAIAEGVNINSQNASGQTALHCACASGSHTKVELLLSAGARNDITDSKGLSILHTSMMSSDDSLPLWLLKKNSISLTHQDMDGNSLLHVAAACGNTGVVNYLVNQKINLGVKNSSGITAATLAAQNGHLQCLQTIVLPGGTIDPDVGAEVLLDYVKLKDIDVARRLVEQVNCNKFRNKCKQSALHIALEVRSLDIVNLLLDNGADINIADDSGQSPLHIACQHLPDLESVIPRLISKDLCISKDKAGNTPLHSGIVQCSCETLVRFLDNEYQRDIQDASGATVAHHLITSCDNKVDELLLSKINTLLSESSECVNALTNTDDTLLHAAVRTKCADLVELILKYHPAVNVSNSDSLSPLHLACRQCQTKVVNLLLRHGADGDQRDGESRTPLFHAVLSSCSDTVMLLIENGADVDLQDDTGRPCIMLAMELGLSSLCVDVLLETTPSQAVRDLTGASLLHYAAEHCSREVVDLLIEQGADINLLDNNKATPLHTASKNSIDGVMTSLLSAGTGLNAQNEAGDSPLHVCSASGSYNKVKSLLDKGADVELRNAMERTCTHLAAMAQDSDVLELLIANEVDIQVEDSEGNTPITLSIINGRVENSLSLLEQGADVIQSNISGDTALHHAMRMSKMDRQLLKLLIRKGRCLDTRNEQGQTPVDILLSRTDLDAESLALDIGLEL